MAGQYEKLPSDDSDDWHTIIDESEKDETVKSSAGNDNNNNSNNIGRIPGNVQVNQGRTNNRNAGASAANSRNMQYESNPPGAGHWEENPDSRKRKVKQNKFM
ncbi:hypothetical protein M7I_7543 [Glarea lozoyensis 74030]|nr:hypothetical protein M7I_7543 [Glarea lozoyensis 74030]